MTTIRAPGTEALEAVARDIAARRASVPAAEVADTDVTGVVGELTRIVAGRLQNRLTEHGITTQVEPPEVELAPASPGDELPQPFTQCFRTGGDGASRFRVTLRELPAES